MSTQDENVPAAAPMVILGRCGESVQWMIGGVPVTFYCLPAAGEPPEPPVKLVDPIVVDPPVIATIIARDPELLSSIVVDASAEPLVLNVEPGGAIDFADYADALELARLEGRQVQVHVSDTEFGG